ncbi:MAG: TPM domain-containing protein [Bacteroidota bacterium]|nr:TPM domain-containing protein [Bacteroidota bacterium]
MKTTGYRHKIQLLLIILITSISSITAQIPERTTPPRLVNDFANILSDREEAYLEHKLVNFNNTTSNQITIVTVTDFNGMSKSQFAYEIGDKWNVGRKKFDNGVVIVIKPKTARSRGEAFIATGYGLESVIPDATANRIIDAEMIPYFKQNNYIKGLDQATNVLMGLAAGEFSTNEYAKKTSSGKGNMLIPFIAIIIAIFMMKRTTKGRTYGHSSTNQTGWLLSALLLSSMGNRHSGYYDSFSSGGGSFGGGGGFSGFGGGSFGGGGAGGSW